MALNNTAANQHREAGVDIAEADAGLSNIVSRIVGTWPKSWFGTVQLPIVPVAPEGSTQRAGETHEFVPVVSHAAPSMMGASQIPSVAAP